MRTLFIITLAGTLACAASSIAIEFPNAPIGKPQQDAPKRLLKPVAMTRLACDGSDASWAPGEEQCMSSLAQCYDACEVAYYVAAAGCTLLPAPSNAICHAENAQNLGRCFRNCR